MTKIRDFIRGDTRLINIKFVQSDGVTPIDITGGKVYFTVNASNSPTDDTSIAFQKLVTSHTNPTQGQTQVKIVTGDTQNIAPGVYYYDVELVDSSGNVTSLKQDEFDINADITRTNT